jgi:A/G-specific adenine glycosylase
MKTFASPQSLGQFRARLLSWYRRNQRDLPWRGSKDPYKIWVAEVMLQQTRIAAVIDYYHRFLKQFPSVQSLARAREPEVLRLWSGLGYYTRARNLRRAAKEIVARHCGQFPSRLDSALELPGIGRYSAGAILSIAYDAPLAVLDGNVARVLARLNFIEGDLRAPQKWKALSRIAGDFLAQNSAGEWNQALMELGETICTPRSPRCRACPVAGWCRAHAMGLVNSIPAPRRKHPAVAMKIAAAVLLDPLGRTLLMRDPGAHDDVLFSRMWQFPALRVHRNAAAELSSHLKKTLGIEGVSPKKLRSSRHGVTFRNLTLLPFLVPVPALPKCAGTRKLPLASISRMPVSSATRKIATSVFRQDSAHH